MITKLIYRDLEFDPTTGLYRLKKNVTGLDWPEVRNVDYVKPAQRGGFRSKSLVGNRPIGFEFLLLANEATYRDARKALFENLNPERGSDTLYIEVDNEALYQLNDVWPNSLEDPDRVWNGRFAECRVELEAFDPVILSQTEKTNSFGITDAGGGAAIPAAIPASLGVSKTFNPTFRNDGNVDADVLWRIDGPGDNFVITNLTTGEQFRLDIELLASEYILVDTKKYTVLQGGVTERSSIFSGDFIKLAPGNNTFSLGVGSGSTDDTAVTGTWRDSTGGI